MFIYVYVQSGMTALLLACAAGCEDSCQILVAPTQAAGAIDVLVCAWLYVFSSLSRHQRWCLHGYLCFPLSCSIDVLVLHLSWDCVGKNAIVHHGRVAS